MDLNELLEPKPVLLNHLITRSILGDRKQLNDYPNTNDYEANDEPAEYQDN
jgi:hypothetical protein